jgi:hypothetical protein
MVNELAQLLDADETKAILAAATNCSNEAITKSSSVNPSSDQKIKAILDSLQEPDLSASVEVARSSTGAMNDPESSVTAYNLPILSGSVQRPVQPLRSQGAAWIPPAYASGTALNDSLRMHAAQLTAKRYLQRQVSSVENSRSHPAHRRILSPSKGQQFTASPSPSPQSKHDAMQDRPFEQGGNLTPYQNLPGVWPYVWWPRIPTLEMDEDGTQPRDALEDPNGFATFCTEKHVWGKRVALASKRSSCPGCGKEKIGCIRKETWDLPCEGKTNTKGSFQAKKGHGYRLERGVTQWEPRIDRLKDGLNKKTGKASRHRTGGKTWNAQAARLFRQLCMAGIDPEEARRHASRPFKWVGKSKKQDDSDVVNNKELAKLWEQAGKDLGIKEVLYDNRATDGYQSQSMRYDANGPEMPNDDEDTTMEDSRSDSGKSIPKSAVNSSKDGGDNNEDDNEDDGGDDNEGDSDNDNDNDNDNEDDSDSDSDSDNHSDNDSYYGSEDSDNETNSNDSDNPLHRSRGNIPWTPDNIRRELLKDQKFSDCDTRWTPHILSLDIPNLVPSYFRPYRDFFVDATMRYLEHYGKDMDTLTVVDFGTAFIAVMSQEDIWSDQIPPVMAKSHWYTVAAELTCTFPGLTITASANHMGFFMTLMRLVKTLREQKGLKPVGEFLLNKDT